MITCTKCGIAKEETLFYNRSDTKTKKTEQCKLCMTLTEIKESDILIK